MLGALGLLGGIAALAAGAAFRRVVVEGDSMAPAVRAGDRLLLVRVPPGAPLRRGRVVAVPDPRDGRRLLVKRVVGSDGDLVELRGDNAQASTDSRHFGPVRRADVVGVALYRYSPGERAGRLRTAQGTPGRA